MSRLTVLCLLVLATACSPIDRTDDPAQASASAAGASFDASHLPTRHWALVEATTAEGNRIDALFPRADKPLQLDFADNRISVGNTCNRIGGSYTLDGNQLSVGGLAQTEMACADAALMQSDAAIGQRLQAGGTLRHDDADTLVFTTTAGETLRFTGTPTADTRYGGPGERVFLEVAAQRVACHHAMVPDYRCLHVREITYGDNGVKTSEGQWQFLYQDIEGYSHQPGTRNVLRLNRYNVANPPADGSSIAYVLDMVVESEVIDR